MDTDEKYLGDEIFVTLAGERGPDWYVEHMESRDSCVRVNPANDHHALDPDVPVDGWITFYDPDLLEAGEPFKHGTFPFRDHRKDGAPWAAFPAKPKGKRQPVWQWKNPEDDVGDLTLSPSIGTGDPVNFHCYVREGKIEWL